LLCWAVSRIQRLVSSLESKPSSSNTGDTMISGAPPRVGTMRRPIYTPSCSTEIMAVPSPTTPQRGTEAGRRRRQYDIEMAEQRGVSAFAREGRTCAPLLDLAHFGWTAAASNTGALWSVRRHRRWLRRGLEIASNFSVLQRRP
jgi:hypothetical protein